MSAARSVSSSSGRITRRNTSASVIESDNARSVHLERTKKSRASPPRGAGGLRQGRKKRSRPTTPRSARSVHQGRKKRSRPTTPRCDNTRRRCVHPEQTKRSRRTMLHGGNAASCQERRRRDTDQSSTVGFRRRCISVNHRVTAKQSVYGLILSSAAGPSRRWRIRFEFDVSVPGQPYGNVTAPCSVDPIGSGCGPSRSDRTRTGAPKARQVMDGYSTS